jgi:hypothetical protein
LVKIRESKEIYLGLAKGFGCSKEKHAQEIGSRSSKEITLDTI